MRSSGGGWHPGFVRRLFPASGEVQVLWASEYAKTNLPAAAVRPALDWLRGASSSSATPIGWSADADSVVGHWPPWEQVAAARSDDQGEPALSDAVCLMEFSFALSRGRTQPPPRRDIGPPLMARTIRLGQWLQAGLPPRQAFVEGEIVLVRTFMPHLRRFLEGRRFPRLPIRRGGQEWARHFIDASVGLVGSPEDNPARGWGAAVCHVLVAVTAYVPYLPPWEAVRALLALTTASRTANSVRGQGLVHMWLVMLAAPALGVYEEAATPWTVDAYHNYWRSDGLPMPSVSAGDDLRLLRRYTAAREALLQMIWVAEESAEGQPFLFPHLCGSPEQLAVVVRAPDCQAQHAASGPGKDAHRNFPERRAICSPEREEANDTAGRGQGLLR